MADRAATIALVGCARAKRPAPAPAGDLYVSDLFRKSRAYAKQCADRWFILSAEHGLLHPEQVVSPYDRGLKNMSAVERAAWASRVLEALEAVLVGADRVVILAGKHYYERLVPALRERGVEVVLPLEGMGIGSRLAWLARHTRELPDARLRKSACTSASSGSLPNSGEPKASRGSRTPLRAAAFPPVGSTSSSTRPSQRLPTRCRAGSSVSGRTD
jgi:hypothetical protein